MRLTTYTDYSLRVLIYLTVHDHKSLAKIQDIADAYQISKNHLMKVVYEMGKRGYLENIRGRNGGLKLAVDPETVNIGTVVREMEEDFHLVECFDCQNNGCIITPACRLKGVLKEALDAYLNVLDQYTLSELVTNRNELRTLLQQNV
ncbi:RrF2 family transcriptional regulator [Salsuginibacillus kocurii]|uniref:RrF2 family transcriptional regulator n=1 Tax=Salsuginibacillus kocurii TaxID=427078 RepID=UPI000374DD2E|nr:Rrf2 family transcriptional regulator [Salsuginibacillus kocurii]